ncbi:hypothetical protein FBEOM_1713 [Fusarium beomiforme]|uniref:DUF6546 domain-containing protein n=1 Tax=Fusarium beomiforme TaxID=44412 RepID=A0A9P5AT71_9HYPO|nr:hypothetical protein FBEOM_1713 [Fusarium beomiforme]
MADQTTQLYRMRLRSSGCLRWSYLPQDMRREILNTIVDQRNPRWSALASVSKEWHSVIGTQNMAKLTLGYSCLEDFDQAVLSEYKCTLCPLTLELNATSASNSKHWFKNFRLNDGHDTPHGHDSVIPVGVMHNGWHDPKHGWVNGVQAKPPPFQAMQRVFGLLTLKLSPKGLPNVNAVTRLMIRRQFRHCLVPSQLALILSKSDRLADIIYEPWSQEYTDTGPWGFWEAREFSACNPDNEWVIGMPLPKTLKRLIFIRDFNQYLSENLKQDSDYIPHISYPWRLPLDDTPSNSKNLVETSFRLDELSVSFLINADDFFAACQKERTWRHLQSLALTSHLLQFGMSQEKAINYLLTAAAKHVLRMPRLTTLVLWHGSRGKACAFIYTKVEHYAHVTWRGTWDIEISQQALKAWEDVAKHHSLELRVRHEHIQETIKSHGDAIVHLNLTCQVIEPTSLWQIRMEHLECVPGALA